MHNYGKRLDEIFEAFFYNSESLSLCDSKSLQVNVSTR